jgi:hypothetical protein
MAEVTDRDSSVRFLLRDNDNKLTEAVDTVFGSKGIEVIPTPYRAPMPKDGAGTV